MQWIVYIYELYEKACFGEKKCRLEKLKTNKQTNKTPKDTQNKANTNKGFTCTHIHKTLTHRLTPLAPIIQTRLSQPSRHIDLCQLSGGKIILQCLFQHRSTSQAGCCWRQKYVRIMLWPKWIEQGRKDRGKEGDKAKGISCWPRWHRGKGSGRKTEV